MELHGLHGLSVHMIKIDEAQSYTARGPYWAGV